ncbi:hypothetical protein B0J14DRAFT_621568 [Halenospora varia]|nr:hypothetical protein B0J14DRAFT_621568 [Halenospora varia]
MVSTAPNTAPKLTSSFTPPPSKFRSLISPDPASEFPSEIGRYALYLHLGCPWAHRTNIVYHLKHLQPIVALSVVSIHRDGTNGWSYDGTSGSDTTDLVEGFKNFKELYEKADPEYKGGYSVQVLWDQKKKTIVNNDSFLTPKLREVNKPGGGLRPEGLKSEIDELGGTIEADFNWGTYKCGIAQSQADYDEAMKRLFGRLDELEKRLGDSKYLLGDHITEPDIRLFTTAKQIRFDYPNLHRWLRQLYYEVEEEARGAFKSTTRFEIVRYAISAMRMKLVPWGPAVAIMPLEA